MLDFGFSTGPDRSARVATSPLKDAELDGRLWDVAPDGSRTLVTRGAFRVSGLPGPAHVTTALEGNGWLFRAGHALLLDMTQNDAPQRRLDNLPSAITWTTARLTLPTP